MTNSPPDSNRSYLELQSTDDGDVKWQRLGVISNNRKYDDQKNPHNFIADSNSSNNSSDRNSREEPKDHRIQLPLSIKNILSPNAKVKSDRRANYMYRHSSDKIDTNLLILLHGAGDSHLPYHALAKKMDIPQTASLSINANAMEKGFTTLPFNLGFTWFEEMDLTTGETHHPNHPKRLSTLINASEKIDRLIDEIILNGQWVPERIFLFGFSAGASLVMNICYQRAMSFKLPLGGAVCVAGGFKGILPGDRSRREASAIGGKIECTPLLLMGGSKDKKYPVSVLQSDALLYSPHNASTSNVVKTYVQGGKGHDMLKENEEVKCLMEFFAEKTVRRMITMEGWSEVCSFSK